MDAPHVEHYLEIDTRRCSSRCNRIRNRLSSVCLHKGGLWAILVLALQITVTCDAFVLKDDFQDITTEFSSMDFTTETVLIDTTTYVTETNENNLKIENTFLVNTIKNTLNVPENITHAIVDDSQTVNMLIAHDELNEIPIEIVDDNLQKYHISDMELNNSEPNLYDDEKITTNLEESIRNSVRNEIQNSKTVKSSPLLDILRDLTDVRAASPVTIEQSNKMLLETFPAEIKQTLIAKPYVVPTNTPVDTEFEAEELLDVKTTFKYSPEQGNDIVVAGEEPQFEETAVTTSVNQVTLNESQFEETSDNQTDFTDYHQDFQIVQQNDSYNASKNEVLNTANPTLNADQNTLEILNDDELYTTENVETANVPSEEHTELEEPVDDDSILKVGLEIVENTTDVVESELTKEIILDTVENVMKTDIADNTQMPNEDITALPELMTTDKSDIENDMDKDNTYENHYIIKKPGVERVDELFPTIIEEEELELSDISTETIIIETTIANLIDMGVEPVTNAYNSEDILFTTNSPIEIERHTNYESINLGVIANSDLNAAVNFESTADVLKTLQSDDDEQMFNMNLAAELAGKMGKALLSRSSDNEAFTIRPTLLIVICSVSGLFVILSMVIYLVSFQRQHGTLNIEMHEQKCGKDNYDEDYEKCIMLIEVDLSKPLSVVGVAEERERCLRGNF